MYLTSSTREPSDEPGPLLCFPSPCKGHDGNASLMEAWGALRTEDVICSEQTVPGT